MQISIQVEKTVEKPNKLKNIKIKEDNPIPKGKPRLAINFKLGFSISLSKAKQNKNPIKKGNKIE